MNRLLQPTPLLILIQPAGAQSDRQLRLSGKGMPVARSTQKDLLKEIENAGKTSPEPEGFFSKVKEMFGG